MNPESVNPWLASQSNPRGETYDAAFARKAAAGDDVHGEATFVQALGPRTVLDAGCGTGRVAVELARRGIDVVGVDIDPGMLDVARRKAPELTWVEHDLCSVDLGRRFDVVVAAGNVMIFLTPGTARAVVANLARHLAPEGLLVAGFQLSGDELSLAEYDAHCHAAGLVTVQRFATWDGAPYSGGDYAVSVCAAESVAGKGRPHPTSPDTPSGA